jgi:hypothetical protein
MLPALLRAFLAPLVLAAAFGATTPSPALPDASLFDYDRDAPLDLRVIDTATESDALLRDLTFAGVDGPIKAYLVRPAAETSAPLAAILYVHWLGNPSTSNRTEFLHEAVALADRGIVSLLIDAMWSEPRWYQNRIPEDDYARSLTQVKNLRRALDVLLAEPGVDPQRVAFVGHDFGAMYGAVMGAVDGRPATYVLMAGAPHFIDWLLFARQPAEPEAYRARLATLDPIHFVGQLAPAPVFFQFAATDDYVSADAASRFYAAARPRKQAATYEARHDLQDPDAAADRIAWLLRVLAPK